MSREWVKEARAASAGSLGVCAGGEDEDVAASRCGSAVPCRSEVATAAGANCLETVVRHGDTRSSVLPRFTVWAGNIPSEMCNIKSISDAIGASIIKSITCRQKEDKEDEDVFKSWAYVTLVDEEAVVSRAAMLIAATSAQDPVKHALEIVSKHAPCH